LGLFPNIGLDKLKLNKTGPWKDIAYRKAFFENYATQNGFDPDNAQHWYLQSIDNITAVKLFPNIGLVKAKLRSSLKKS